MYGTHGSEYFTRFKMPVSPYCGQFADAQWSLPHPQSGCQTDDAACVPKGCEIITHIRKFSGKSKAASQRRATWLKRMGLGFYGV